jgi:hypothetical protein
MTKPLSRWRKLDLGEMSNSWILVSNWRHKQVDWMLEYLMELRVCSIYRALEQWLMNLKETRGDRRGGRALAQVIGGIYRTCKSESLRRSTASRHVSSERQIANSGELIHSSCDSGGYGGRSKIVAGVHPRRDISLPLCVI